jgi:hypothetical protein
MKGKVSFREKNISETTSILIKFFSVTTDKPEEFVDDLEKLCVKFAGADGYFFKYSVEG